MKRVYVVGTAVTGGKELACPAGGALSVAGALHRINDPECSAALAGERPGDRRLKE